MRSTRIAALSLVAGLAACAPTTPTFGDADAAAIRQSTNDFATHMLAGHWDAWVGLFADNVTFLPPNGAIVSGKAAVKAFGEGYPKVTAFTPTVVDVGGSGDVAFARGTYSITVAPAGAAAMTDKGKWLAVYRKQADGSWKVTYDMWNSDLPAAPMGTPSKAAPAKAAPTKAPAKAATKKGR